MWLNGAPLNARPVNGVTRLPVAAGGVAVIDGLATALEGLTRTGGGTATFPLTANLTPLALRTLVGTATTTAGVSLAGSRVMGIGGTLPFGFRADFYQESDRYFEGTAQFSYAATLNVNVTFWEGTVGVVALAEVADARAVADAATFTPVWVADLAESAVRHIAGVDTNLVEAGAQFEPSWTQDGVNYVGGFGVLSATTGLADDAFRVQPFVGSFDLWGGVALGPVVAVRRVTLESLPVYLEGGFAPYRHISIHGEARVALAAESAFDVTVPLVGTLGLVGQATAADSVVRHGAGELRTAWGATGELLVVRCATGNAVGVVSGALTPVRIVKVAGTLGTTLQVAATALGIRALAGNTPVVAQVAESFDCLRHAVCGAPVQWLATFEYLADNFFTGDLPLRLQASLAPVLDARFSGTTVSSCLAALVTAPTLRLGEATFPVLGGATWTVGALPRDLDGALPVTWPSGLLVARRVRALAGEAGVVLVGTHGHDLVSTTDDAAEVFVRPAHARVVVRPFFQREFLRAA